MASSTSNDSDPAYLHKLLDKYVTVNTIKSQTYSGFVDSIDPISKSVVISILKGEQFHKSLILGHAIISIENTEPNTNLRPSKKEVIKLTENEINNRKMKVIAWLKKNLLPVEENNGIIDLGNVSIIPPYMENDICSDNATIVLEMRKILNNMPEDFQP